MQYAFNSGLPFQTLRVELVREGVVCDYLVNCSEDIFEAMKEAVSRLDREFFWVVLLNTKHKVIGINLVSMDLHCPSERSL